MQFGKDISEGKYDYTAEGKQQLLLPSEYKKAVAAKSPAPVISWHPHVIAACWKVACRLVSKLDAEKKVSRDCMEWVDTELAAHDTVRHLPCGTCHRPSGLAIGMGHSSVCVAVAVLVAVQLYLCWWPQHSGRGYIPRQGWLPAVPRSCAAWCFTAASACLLTRLVLQIDGMHGSWQCMLLTVESNRAASNRACVSERKQLGSWPRTLNSSCP